MSKPRSTDIYEAEDRLLAKDGHITGLEAKLAMVKELALRNSFATYEGVSGKKAYVDFSNNPEVKPADILAILSDTEPPLAVERGAHTHKAMLIDSKGVRAISGVEVFLPDVAIGTAVDVIVMARKEEK